MVERQKGLNDRQYKQSAQKTQTLDFLLTPKTGAKQKNRFFEVGGGISFFFTFSF
jgi:hypothetical protein